MDLIDRQDLLKYLDGYRIDEHDEEIIDIVEQMPTVEKRGEWERHPDFLHICSVDFANIHRCSLCKERPLYRMGYEVLSNYCPNCGAEMRGENK